MNKTLTRVARAMGRARSASSSALLEPLEQRLAFNAAVAPDTHTLVQFNTTYGAMVIELFNDTAPITVANFLNYVNSDRLDGTFFHRAIRKASGGIDIFQGGGFTFQDGDGQPPAVQTDAPIVLEDTGHSNLAGTIAMARTPNPNSATSGFFFNVTDNPGLDTTGGGYAVFGQIVNGYDVLQRMFALRIVDLDSASLYDNTPVTENFSEDATQISEADLVYLNSANVIDRAAFRTVPGSSVSGASSAADDVFITSIGSGGAAQVFTDDGPDFWQYTNLSATTGAPAVTGNLVSFFDPKTGLKHAVGPSAAGVILFTQAQSGAWSFRNLTTETSGQNVAGKLTVFTTTDGFVYAAGVTDAGHLVAYRQTGTQTEFQWEFRDITAQDLTVRGLATPSFEGDLTSYVTAWNGLNIVGLDSDGEIQVVWWSPGIDQNLWTTSNLSDITGAPRLTGGLTVYLTSWQATNIVGITQDGNVSVTWWLPEFGGNWNSNDLTSQFGGPDLQASTITSYVTPWGATNIAGLDTNGTLFIYWWTPDLGDGAWVITDLFAAMPAGTKPMVGQITGVTSAAATINLVGSAANGDVMRYSWNASDGLGWLGEDVSYLASIS